MRSDTRVPGHAQDARGSPHPRHIAAPARAPNCTQDGAIWNALTTRADRRRRRRIAHKMVRKFTRKLLAAAVSERAVAYPVNVGAGRGKGPPERPPTKSRNF